MQAVAGLFLWILHRFIGAYPSALPRSKQPITGAWAAQSDLMGRHPVRADAYCPGCICPGGYWRHRCYRICIAAANPGWLDVWHHLYENQEPLARNYLPLPGELAAVDPGGAVGLAVA